MELASLSEITKLSTPHRLPILDQFVGGNLGTPQHSCFKLVPNAFILSDNSLSLRPAGTWRFAPRGTMQPPANHAGSAGAAGSAGGIGNGNGRNRTEGPRRIDDQRISYEGKVWFEQGTLGRIVFGSYHKDKFSGDVENQWRIFCETENKLQPLPREDAAQLIRSVHAILNPMDSIEAPLLTEGIHRGLQRIFNSAYAIGERAEFSKGSGGMAMTLPYGGVLTIETVNWPQGDSHRDAGNVANVARMLPRQFLDMVDRIQLNLNPNSTETLAYNSNYNIRTSQTHPGIIQIYKSPHSWNLYTEFLRILSDPLFDGRIETQEMLYVLASFADGMDPPEQKGLESIGHAIASHAKAMALVPDGSFAMVNKGWVEFNPMVAHFFLTLLSNEEGLAYRPEDIQAAARSAEQDLWPEDSGLVL